jgi:hypothetical protein
MEQCLITTRDNIPFFYLYISMRLQMLLHHVCTCFCLSCDNCTKEVPLCVNCFLPSFAFVTTKTFIHVDEFYSLIFISDVHIMSSLIFCLNLDNGPPTCGLPVHFVCPSHDIQIIECGQTRCWRIFLCEMFLTLAWRLRKVFYRWVVRHDIGVCQQRDNSAVKF